MLFRLELHGDCLFLPFVGEGHFDGGPGGGAALYELEYETGEMRYTCYIDGESGECLGLDFEPIPVDEYPSYYSFPTARAAIA